MEELNPLAITDDAYCRRYLTHLLEHRIYYLHIYAFLLEKSEALLRKSIYESKLTDYGSGNGLLGIFAAFCGYKEVILHEQDPIFLKSSMQIAACLSVDRLYFVGGNELSFDDENYTTNPDAIVSTDVIEHIYNLELFFAETKRRFADCIHVHATAANSANLLIVQRLKKLQRLDEWHGSSKDAGVMTFDRDHPSFYSLRKKIIESFSNQFSKKRTEHLAKLTRGMNKADIQKAIQLFLKTGELPSEIIHPTNTCHPETGSWTERLMSISEYQELFNSHGYAMQTDGGFYDEYSLGRKKYLTGFLNRWIHYFGLKFSPFIVLTGIPQINPID